MLQTIRDKLSGWVARIVLGALAVVFVFWGIELRSAYSASNYAASVNGDKISLNEAHAAWQQQQTQLQQQLHGDIPDILKKTQQQAIMDRLVNTQLLQQQINKLGYGVSDEALAKALQDVQEFKVDGKFNPERYAGMISSLGKTKSQFEHDYRNQLALQRLQNGLVNTSFVTPAETARAQALLGEQRDVEYVTIDAKSFLPTVNISDAEVQAYYDANKNVYMTPETVGLQYVDLKLSDVASEVTVTEEALRAHYEQIKDKFSSGERRHAHHILITTSDGVDDAKARQQAEELYAKLKSGANFEALAKESSKDPGSAVKGGDLGWAKRGDFVKPFEEALFSMSPGDIRGPIKSDFGYHIIRLDEVEGSSKTYEQVRVEVEADYRNEQAHSIFYERTQKFADAAFSATSELDSVAKRFNTAVKTIPNFTRNGGGEFAKGSPVIDAAFSEAVLEKGQNSSLVTIGEERALVVRINDHKLPEQKPLEQVRGEIVSMLKDNAAKAAVVQKADEIVKQLHEGSLLWGGVVKQSSSTVATKQTIGRSGSSLPQPVVQSAFSLPKSDIAAGKAAYSSTMLDNGDYAIVSVSAVKSGSEADNAAQMLPSIESQRAMQLGRSDFANYVQELKRTAKIDINPAAFD